MSSTIVISLNTESLWMEKYPNVEMVVRKPKPIFPDLVFTATGLDPEALYAMQFALERMDDVRYAFKNGEWGTSEMRNTKKAHLPKYIDHSSGIQKGCKWMEGPFDFNNIRVSCQEQDQEKSNVVYADTMHKYIPVLTITNMDTFKVETVRFEKAQFIAVTTYVSKDIGEWKAVKNKYSTIKNGGVGGGKRSRRTDSDADKQPAKKRKSVVRYPSNDVLLYSDSNSTTTNSSSGSPTTPAAFNGGPAYSTAAPLSGVNGTDNSWTQPIVPINQSNVHQGPEFGEVNQLDENYWRTYNFHYYDFMYGNHYSHLPHQGALYPAHMNVAPGYFPPGM